ncbi:antibiotic biosynthesis monooxygenase [Roseibium sp. HPY-6]|uniref:antibiotic biosynthesis monooxygenase family protein n=1 Tax=Roseibium sp. HPY-6 TaxID=3229852 RepID=UPI00338EC1B3
MIAVIFESWPKDGRGETYLDMGRKMNLLVEGFDGFVSIERFESVVEPGKFVAISYWRDEQAVASWRNVAEHRKVQDGSRRTVFDNYCLRVAKVIRDYGMRERADAPKDSLEAHDAVSR